MSWDSEIKDAQYTSPSGKSFVFKYGALSRETDLKTATFTFPEKDGALVVPLGVGGKTFPMSCTFFGDSCLKDADAFEAGLMERGYGELQHPVYGVHKVVPTGSIKRSDDLVKGLNVSQVDITFAETIIDETYPDSLLIGNDEIAGKVDEFNGGAAEEFVKNMNPESVAESLKAQSTLKNLIRKIKDSLEPLVKMSTSAYALCQEVDEGLQESLVKLTEKKDEIVNGILKVVNIGSTLATGIKDKINCYKSLIVGVTDGYKKLSAGINAAKNDFISVRLVLSAAVVALTSGVALTMDSDGEIDSPASVSSSGVVNASSNPGRFKSRDEAVECAVTLTEIYDKVVAFLDSKTDEDLVVETGESFDAMRDVVALSVSQIVEQSFNLSTRKKIVLGRDRQIMELLAELYGDFDRVDEFIIDNNLTYDEIELIPMGREVAYYV